VLNEDRRQTDRLNLVVSAPSTSVPVIRAIPSRFFQASYQASLMAHTHNKNRLYSSHEERRNDADDSELSHNDRKLFVSREIWYKKQKRVSLERHLYQLVESAKTGAAAGIRPPRFAYDIALDETAEILSGAPFNAESQADAPLWADAKTKIEALLNTNEINQSRANKLLAEVETALQESFEPSYQSLMSWLQSKYENTDEAAQGVGALNDGDNYYQARLSRMTTTELSADEIHNLGLREVARIKLEMEAIKQQVGFGGSLLEFFNDSQFVYLNDDEDRQGYLDDSTDFISAMRDKLPDYFGILPRAELEVRQVEAFRQQDGAPQHYQSGVPDGSRPGVYYAHLSDMNLMELLIKRRYELITVQWDQDS
jgi:uncharacterized protein (DUF885 family)